MGSSQEHVSASAGSTDQLNTLPDREERVSVDQAMADMAEQLAEEPTRLTKRKDVTQILEKMTDGVVVTLHISRPRFTVSIAPKRGGTTLGLEKLGITNSQEAQKVVKEYFSLGRHSLLPTRLQKELAAIENTARACLDRCAFRTHWGYFVPIKNYQAWKAENEKHEQKFHEKKRMVLDHYDEMMEEVLAAYRRLAEDAWMQLAFGSLVVRDQRENLSREMFEGLYEQLESGRGKEEFIQAYVSSIQNQMPTREGVADAFAYETELGYIPLPSLLARDMDEADDMVRSRAVRGAKLHAELDAIEAQRRAELDAIQYQQRLEEAKQQAEWHKLNEQQRAEQQATSLKVQVEEEKLRAEREKLDIQRAMDRDVINHARIQKDQLVQEFYTEVIAHINQLVKEVCEETLESLDEHHAVLRGPVSVRLGNLVNRLKNLNFLEDEQIERQIQQLEAVLPTKDAKDQAKRGMARIETSGIRRVVQQLHREAEMTLIELGLSPVQRRSRQVDETQEDALGVNKPRRARRSLEFSNPSTTAGTRRRTRGSRKGS